MLAPGQSLTDHLAKLQQSNAPAGGRRRAAEPDDTLMPATGFLPAAQGADPTSVIPPRSAWNGARAARDAMPGTVVASSGAKRNAAIGNLVDSAKQATGKAVATVQGWPRNKQLIAAGGALAVVVVLVLVFSLAGGGGGDATPPLAQSTTSAESKPTFDTQEYNDRGISVQVPKGWKHNASGSWVDYYDPTDSKHKVRILVEKSTAAPTAFLGIAENTLKTKSTSCPKPYDRVALTKTTISDKDGAVLEYKCGTGDSARHGLWGAVVTGGHAYSFYMTSTEAQFADSKPIFDEMIKTYTLQAS
jgi:hypothetical protein